MILEAIHHSDGHLTAEEIYQRVREKYPYLNKSVIYRTLDVLKELRIVTEIDVGVAETQYELTGEPHLHLVCRKCGRIEKADPDLLRPVDEAISARHGFKADFEHLGLFGLCQKCSEEVKRNAHS